MPSIACDISGVNEDVYDGLTGRVSAPENFDHVADSIQKNTRKPCRAKSTLARSKHEIQ